MIQPESPDDQTATRPTEETTAERPAEASVGEAGEEVVAAVEVALPTSEDAVLTATEGPAVEAPDPAATAAGAAAAIPPSHLPWGPVEWARAGRAVLLF